jgi:hypothetical protein
MRLAFILSGRVRREAAVLQNGGFLRSSLAEQAELGQGGHAIIEADFLDDFAALDLEDGGAGKVRRRPGRYGCRRVPTG